MIEGTSSDGNEDMTDNRYLKANYPLLVRLSISDTYSSLRDTIKLEKWEGWACRHYIAETNIFTYHGSSQICRHDIARTMEHFPIARVNFFAYFVGESCKQDEKSDKPHGESFNLEMREEQFTSFATIISQRMEKVNELCGSPYFVDHRKENFSGTNVEEEFDL
ncbi:hypothetical protein Tco_0517297 [Tanacetum coccineum]